MHFDQRTVQQSIRRISPKHCFSDFVDKDDSAGVDG
jgi:hypothetical protein